MSSLREAISAPFTRAVASSTPAPPASTATPRPPVRITIGLPVEPASLAAPPNDGEIARLVGNLLFSQLVGLDDGMQPFPDLAVDIPTIANGGARLVSEGDGRYLEVTFRIRPGIRWSDGAPLTAKDVVFSWQVGSNTVFGPPVSTERRIESAIAIDDSTVRLNYFSERSARDAAQKAPNRLGFLADQRGPVLDPQYFRGLPNTWIYPVHILGPLVNDDGTFSPRLREVLTTSTFARNPVGTGPYVPVEWVAGQIIRMKSRPLDSRPPPVVPLLDLRILNAAPPLIPTDTVEANIAWISPPERFAPLVSALVTGGVDVIPGMTLNASQASQLRRISSVRMDVRAVASNQSELLQLNLDSEILRDMPIRQALALAIDRQELIRAMGGSDDDKSVWQRGTFAATFPLDTSQAKKLLDGAGWVETSSGIRSRGGKPLQVRLVTGASPPHSQVAALLREQFGRIGIELIIESLPNEKLFDRSGPLARQNFDLALVAIDEGGVGDTGPIARFGSGQIPSPRTGWIGFNVSGFRDPEVDQLIKASLVELDPARLASIRYQIDQKVIAAIPEIPLFAYPRYLASRPLIRGLKPGIGAIGDTWNSHLWSITNP